MFNHIFFIKVERVNCLNFLLHSTTFSAENNLLFLEFIQVKIIKCSTLYITKPGGMLVWLKTVVATLKGCDLSLIHI